MSSLLQQFLNSKIKTAVFLLISLFFIGTFGFRYMSQYSWIDALYMTVITITTVGFGEVQPLDEKAKVFTVFLILTSVIILGYALKTITDYIISRNERTEIKLKKMQKKIDQLSQHSIICGYGRNGKQAAKKLAAYNRTYVVIEKDKEMIPFLENDMVNFVIGDANDDEILLRAGVKRANSLISALPNDADNVFVVLTTRQFNPQIKIISRASEETSYTKLKLAGANNVILPDNIGGDHMASLVVAPDLIDFIDNLNITGNHSTNLEQVSVDDLYDTSVLKTIEDLDLRKKTGCNVIGLIDPSGKYTINPEASQELVAHSKIIVLGRPEQIKKLNSTYNIKP